MFKKIQNFNFLKLKHLALAFFIASFFIFFFLPFGSQAAGPTWVYGVIDEDQIWTKENSPYIIGWQENGLILRAKLTIQPGTVIKIYGNKWWHQFYGLKVEGNNNGSLQILGISDEPVIFTSYFDDSYYGDTDGFEGLFAEPGDYQGVTFVNDNNSSIQNTEFNYCGSAFGNEGCLVFDNSDLNFTNIKIRQSLNPGVLVKNNSQAGLDNLDASENSNEVLQLNDKSRIILNNSNLYHNHGNYLFRMSAGSDLLLETNNSFNDNDNLLIKLGQYLVENSVTWHNYGLPYFAMGSLFLDSS